MNDAIRHALDHLVIANRIIRAEQIVDDLMEFDLDSNAVNGDTRPSYVERFIHGAIHAAR
jgi:hypothetical protein